VAAGKSGPENSRQQDIRALRDSGAQSTSGATDCSDNGGVDALSPWGEGVIHQQWCTQRPSTTPILEGSTENRRSANLPLRLTNRVCCFLQSLERVASWNSWPRLGSYTCTRTKVEVRCPSRMLSTLRSSDCWGRGFLVSWRGILK